MAPVDIDWTVPPYTVGGLVRLVLENEDPATITRQEADRRVFERYVQLRAKAASWWNLEAGSDPVAAARRVFAYYPAEDVARPA